MFIKPNPTPAQLEAAYAAGVIRKEHLQDGAYYRGYCRNARVARWHASTEQFIHCQHEMGLRMLESIKHAADEARYDVFVPLERIAFGRQRGSD